MTLIFYDRFCSCCSYRAPLSYLAKKSSFCYFVNRKVILVKYVRWSLNRLIASGAEKSRGCRSSLIWNAVWRGREEGMKPSRGTNHVGDNEKVNWATLAKCPVGIAFDSHSANLSREPIVKYSVCVFFLNWSMADWCGNFTFSLRRVGYEYWWTYKMCVPYCVAIISWTLMDHNWIFVTWSWWYISH